MKHQNSSIIVKPKVNTNLVVFQPKQFLYSYIFLKNIYNLFLKKGIYISRNFLNFKFNYLVLNLEIFFTTQKLNLYKKYKRRKISYKKKLASNIFDFSSLKFLQVQYVLLNTKVVNKIVDKNQLRKVYNVLKIFQRNLFFRRVNLYFDFLKLLILFNESKISLNLFAYVLGQIFKPLSKKNHTRYFLFLKLVFKTLIFNKVDFNSNIKGIKCLISGRIQGKTRANSNLFQIGKVPLQSTDKNIEYSKFSVSTIYGLFGFKIWIYRE